VNLCKPHWDELKAEIQHRGLGDFVAEDGKEILGKVEKELTDGQPSIETIDPLLGASNMIFGRALEIAGLNLMHHDPETGKPHCPLCAVAGPYAGNWIKGAVNDMEIHVREYYRNTKPI
jgi:hypothetical protein